MNIKKIFPWICRSGKPPAPSKKARLFLLRYSIQYGLWGILYGLSAIYSSLVQLRITLYQKRILTRHSLPCPIISIGNITAGGTGKTPMVILVAQILRKHGKRVAILSRGYRRNTSESPGVSPAQEDQAREASCDVVGADSDVRLVGDEPLLMARTFQREQSPTLPEVSVIVGNKRSLAGRLAIAQFQPEVMLLDDGFQHIQLERTFDLVLIDATNPFGGNHLLPAGFLREPVKNLRRADAFVITRSDEIADISPIYRRLQQINPKVPIFSGRHGYDEIKSVETHQSVALDVLKDQRLLEVSGIANPASFHRLLRGLSLPVVHYLDFPDHHWYTEQDLSDIQRIISTHHLDSIITTEKDEVKLLRHVDILNVPIYVMAIRLDVCPGEEFEKLLLESIAASTLFS